jgi:ribose transport system permease protein
MSAISTLPPADTKTRRRLLAGRAGSYGPLFALIAVSVVFAALNPTTFPTPENFRTILDQAALPLILSIGATYVILMGCIDLSIEGVMAASGLTFVLLSANSVNGMDLGPIAAVAAVAMGLVFGLCNGLIHTRFRIPSFMASLGLWYIGLGLATMLFGSTVPRLQNAGLAQWVSATPLGASNAFVVALVLVVLAGLVSRYTRLGRFTLAIGADEGLSRLSSVPVARYKVYVFVLAGICSAVAGVLGTMRLGVGIVEVGSGQLFFTTAAVVVGGTVLSGGKGGILHSVIGVLLLTVINNGLVLSGVDPTVQQAIAGIVIVAAVVITGLRNRGRLKVVK